MRHWIQENRLTIAGWVALIVGAVIAFWTTRGTYYHQLAVGILASSVTLLVALSLLEGICQTITAAVGR